jgi:AbrB family looped-hinge helix DNA binding protein
MVKLRLKIGPKGQIIIPKILREKYGIRENSYVLVDVREDGIIIKKMPEPEEILSWIKERRKKIRGLEAKPGELAEIDLEEEF